MQIIIPTYKRAWSQHTFEQLPRRWRDRTTFVVNEEDAKLLSKKYSGYEDSTINIIPNLIKTIAQKRAWILRTTSHKTICMLDDDLDFRVRNKEGKALKHLATEKTIGNYFNELESKLNTVVHAGFGPKQGNNRQPGGWVSNTRMIYVLGYNVETVRRNCELGRIEHREDMDYTLQLLRAGFPNEVCMDICVDQKYNAPGGANEERTIENSNNDAFKLAKLHPGFVRIAKKKYKASIPRYEVVCYWKKAYESSRP